MNVVCVVISDRGDLYLPGCLESLNAHLDAHIPRIVVDDSKHELGMAGTVQKGWTEALHIGAEYVFHCEEDFRFHDLPLDQMRWILDRCQHLAQVVLKRQPWSAEEHAAGGQMEINPGAYTQMRGLRNDAWWCEHQTLFSLNPCLIPRRTLELGWPSGPLGVGNETGMTKRCVDRGMSFAYYGKKDDPPRCEHVGHLRASGWRL